MSPLSTVDGGMAATPDPYVHKPGMGPTSADLTGEGPDDETMDTGGKSGHPKTTPMETDQARQEEDEASVADREKKKQVIRYS